MTETLTIEAEIEKWNEVRFFVENFMQKNAVSTNDMMMLDIAIEEIFVNVASYAYAPNHGMVTIEVSMQQNPKAMQVVFTDQGIPYNPLDKEDPDVNLKLEEREIGGLGIYMVKQSMDAVRYAYKDNRNILTIVKNLE